MTSALTAKRKQARTVHAVPRERKTRTVQQSKRSDQIVNVRPSNHQTPTVPKVNERVPTENAKISPRSHQTKRKGKRSRRRKKRRSGRKRRKRKRSRKRKKPRNARKRRRRKKSRKGRMPSRPKKTKNGKPVV